MTLVPSQVILGLAIAGLIVYAFRLRTVLVDRMIYLVLALSGLVLVMRPSWSTELAHLLGIGRGADLLLYTLVILSLFRDLAVASELKQIDRRITLIVRARALDGPLTISPGGRDIAPGDGADRSPGLGSQ